MPEIHLDTDLGGDIIDFQHDSLACAIALGWKDGIEIEEYPLFQEEKAGWLYERISPAGNPGNPVHVVTKVDGSRFNEFWLRKMMNR